MHWNIEQEKKMLGFHEEVKDDEVKMSMKLYEMITKRGRHSTRRKETKGQMMIKRTNKVEK